ncbi:hypothetical protein HHI36_015756 [Cryptolaemus montrouzieri]|uniref:Uncharacterized protein n=1 Tax=Cryptolaemus montrouzieri TaxID=559131 RepID=A0ABD2N6R7_9CUCU
MRSNLLVDVRGLMEIIYVLSSPLPWLIYGSDFLKLLERLKLFVVRPDNYDETCKQIKILCHKFNVLTIITFACKSLYNYLSNEFCEGKTYTDDPRYLCGMWVPHWFPIVTDYFPVPSMRSNLLVDVRGLMEIIYVLSSPLPWLIYGSDFLKLLERLKLFVVRPDNYDETCKQIKILCYKFNVLTIITFACKSLYNYLSNEFCEGKIYTDDPRYLCGMWVPHWFPIVTDYFPDASVNCVVIVCNS